MSADFKTELITLPVGQIKGVKRSTIYDRNYFSFEAIPYAKPPIGELRFRAPQPAEPWEGVRDCTSYAKKPVQNNPFRDVIEGSEDCLYLNVYSKTLKSDKQLPVMVWIYGGGFSMGEATREEFSPDYFMEENIVLVTINYRVGALGFLKLGDQKLNIPGNAGLKDQVLALKWVKKYISHFNGDENNITLFGESAGGASTHFLMITDQAKGLFHRAIPQSGCAVNNWSIMPQTDMAYRLAKYHGYKGENVDSLVLAYLKSLEPYKMVEPTSLFDQEEQRNGWLFNFGPTIEAFIGEDCVIPKDPLEMLKTAWSNEIPVMIGGTSFEGLLMYKRLKMFPQMMNNLKKDPERILPKEVRDTHTSEENKELAEKLIRLHFGNEEPNEDHLFKFLDLYSYKLFWLGLYRTILARIHYAKAPTYLYRFDFDSPDYNLYRTKFCGSDAVRGVAHADELGYLFFSKDSWKVSTDSDEYKTIQRMISMWTSFAKSSDPNCDLIKPIVWEPLDKIAPHRALNINNTMEMMDLPEKNKLEIWGSVYKQGSLF